MKKYIEKHESKIKYHFSPVDYKNAKDGDMVDHEAVIDHVEFMRAFQYDEHGQNKYIEITLDPEMVIDLYKEIMKLKRKRVMMSFDNLPF